MSEIDVEWVIDTAISYVDADAKIFNRYPELEELEEFLLDHNVERCSTCEHWVHSHDIAMDENEEPTSECLDCAPNLDESDC